MKTFKDPTESLNSMLVLHGAIVAGVAAVSITFFSVWSDNDLQTIENEYCRMVELYSTTEGEYGWPDYKGTAEETCGISAEPKEKYEIYWDNGVYRYKLRGNN